MFFFLTYDFQIWQCFLPTQTHPIFQGTPGSRTARLDASRLEVIQRHKGLNPGDQSGEIKTDELQEPCDLW